MFFSDACLTSAAAILLFFVGYSDPIVKGDIYCKLYH